MISENYDELGLKEKKAVILHGTAGSFKSAVDWLCTPAKNRDPVSYSSAHYVISKNGTIARLVDGDKRAWHAGATSKPTKEAIDFFGTDVLGRIKNPNNVSIGVELEHFDKEEITNEQIIACADVIKECQDKGWLVNDPAFFVHAQVTDYKYDFKKNGVIDTSIIDKIKSALKPNRENLKQEIINLIKTL